MKIKMFNNIVKITIENQCLCSKTQYRYDMKIMDGVICSYCGTEWKMSQVITIPRKEYERAIKDAMIICYPKNPKRYKYIDGKEVFV